MGLQVDWFCKNIKPGWHITTVLGFTVGVAAIVVIGIIRPVYVIGVAGVALEADLEGLFRFRRGQPTGHGRQDGNGFWW